MSRRYLYAVVKHRPVTPLGPGLAGEPLSLVAVADVVAVVGEMADAPAATPDTLRGHDEVVRRLAGISDAILPARFGTVQEATALAEWLTDAAEGLGEALDLVTGREQMTLHVFQDEAPVAVAVEVEARGESADETGLGPGARYLAERRRHWLRKERVPELEPLRPRLDALVTAERVERRTTPPLRASVYHLIERGRSAEYRDAVEASLDLVVGVRLRVSGPWAPYAFAPASPALQ
ncbi:MAG TPA: GvpL/GvpF family gas vesicle protein [Candidatus Acidoferrum sp.]|nr:GvpL/GvpF family gas vesicle protein [Candidatus Acidoferrum sp.]